MSVAIYVGSFDPCHLGHIDIIHTAINILQVDRLVIGIGINSSKTSLFTPFEREIMLHKSIAEADIPASKLMVESYSTLTGEFILLHQPNFIIRGMRDNSDAGIELNYARTMNALYGIQTVLIPSHIHLSHISSSLVRTIYSFNVDSPELLALVPQCVHESLRKRGKE